MRIGNIIYFFSPILLLFLCCLLPVTTNCQSLKSLTYEELVAAAERTFRANPDSSVLYAKQAISFVSQRDTIRWIKAHSQLIKAVGIPQCSDTSLTIYAKQLLKIADAFGNQETSYQVNNLIAGAYGDRLKLSMALKYVKDAHEIAVILDSSSWILHCQIGLGAIESALGRPSEGLDYLLSAYPLTKKVNNLNLTANLLVAIAGAYSQQKSYEKATEYFIKAAETKELAEHWRGARWIYYNMYLNSQYKKDYIEAEWVVMKMTNLDSLYGGVEIPTHFYYVSKTNLASTWVDQGRPLEALQVLSEKLLANAEQKLEDNQLQEFLSAFYIMQAKAHNSLGKSEVAWKTLSNVSNPSTLPILNIRDYYLVSTECLLALKKPHKVIQYSEEGLKRLKNSGNPEISSVLLKRRSIAYQMLPTSEKVVKAILEYHDFKDSLWNEQKSIEVGALQNKVELIESESKNETLQAQADLQAEIISNQRIVFIAAILAAILILIIAVVIYRQLVMRKDLIKQIKAQADKLQELDHAKSRFFGNISHDLRSPLTLILGALDQINEKDHEWLDKESTKLLDIGMKNSKRLLYLTDEIMELTRLEEGKMQMNFQLVLIVPYLQLLTRMFSSAAEVKSIELELSANIPKDSILQLDPKQFEKIMYNLISNAIKFTPEHGQIAIILESDRDAIQIEVSDTGPGISQEGLTYIFDRYYQAETMEFTAQTGVGIGLALVKELVELHHGQIQVSSSEKGTSFIVKIPRAKTSIAKGVVPEQSLDVITKNSLWVDLYEGQEAIQIGAFDELDNKAKRILIVEDHKELRYYIKSILAGQYKIYVAEDGHKALEVLKSQPIDLILTDLMMPYMDGFELIEVLKKDKELNKIPVLVLSARTDHSEKLKLISKGAGIIHKPFDREELKLTIHHLLQMKWDSEVELNHLYGDQAESYEKNIMAKLEDYILTNISNPHLSVSGLANEIAASERKLHRLVKKITEMSPYELIKEVRLQYVHNYIEKNKVTSAKQVAQLVGMNNASYFNEQYQKRFGVSIYDLINQD